MHVDSIRVNDELRAFFQRLREKGAYYWKLSVAEAETLIRLLCVLYDVPEYPSFSTGHVPELKARGACGLCSWRGHTSDIYTFPRPHFKTVAHEVYHHIDFYYTRVYGRRTYNSSDSKRYA